MKTEYLLRFDDMTPEMDRGRWERFVPLLDRFDVKPILAVVPENHDPELSVAEPDAGFWSEMRAWQQKGATIALHGYRHLCVSRGRALLPMHGNTEFAGVPEDVQRGWIEAGLKILRWHALDPKLWVGPRHGTDAGTVRGLASAGIRVISDGLWTEPVRWHGAVWIPQQIWEPRAMPPGLWTICLHAHTATDALVEELERFLEQNAAAFTSVDRVLTEWAPRRYGANDWARQKWWLAKRQLRRGMGRGM